MSIPTRRCPSRRHRRWGILGAIAFSYAACTDATDVELLQISGSAVIFGQAVLDLDGTGTATAADTVIADRLLILSASSTGNVVDTVTTDSTGFFLIDVPLGSYNLSLDSVALGDSLDMVGAGDPIVVGPGDTLLAIALASYPVLSLEEVMNATPGSRVFTHGIALNPRLNFDPSGRVHFRGDSLFLRALNVERSPVATGDSVRILGRVTVNNTRVALDPVTPYLLIPQAAVVLPEVVSTSSAAIAAGGRLDAGLVRINKAQITDTSTNVSGHFRFWADDGTDSVEVVIRDLLGLNTSAFRPDTVVQIARASGLLTPLDEGGTVRWQLLPRSGTDIVLENRLADVRVLATIDTTMASLGDTVQVTVVASNLGPLTATGLQVRDTIPSALMFVDATTSAGSYAAGSGIWDVGDLVSAGADTLVLRMEVTGMPATIPITSETLPLTIEIDPNAGNNRVVLFLTIS